MKWTIHKANIAMAIAQGKAVQYHPRTDAPWQDVAEPHVLGFGYPDECYRIKPEPTSRFWKPEEVPVGWQVRMAKKPRYRGVLVCVDADGDAVCALLSSINPDNFHEYEVAPPGPANAVTWVPAGVEE